MPTPLVRAIDRNRAAMDDALHRDINPDMHIRDFSLCGRETSLYYADGLCSVDFLQHYVLAPLMELPTASSADLAALMQDAVCNADVQQADTVQAAVSFIMTGRAVVIVDGMSTALGYDVRAFVHRGVGQPMTERVVSGPHEGFNESLRDCITLIRRILPTPDLIGEMIPLGEACPTSCCVMYLHGAADAGSVRRVKNRLKRIRAGHVLSIGAVQQMMEDRPFSLLPQCVLTERPDRTASMLLEGSIAILLDGSPAAMLVPVSIFHLLHTPDDTSLRWQYGTFLRLIRLVGLLCAWLLPGLFVACVTFHPEALPLMLLTAILESQSAVPFSIPVETLLMLLMFNLIGEAATRVPSVVGSTLGTVSGLILGQAAVEANLAHPLLLIVVAVSSLGSYAVPDYSLGLAVRIGQLGMLLAGCIFGVYGMVLFLAAGCVRLCALTSLGSPMAAPIAPWRMHHPDVLIRAPLWLQRGRMWLMRKGRGE